MLNMLERDKKTAIFLRIAAAFLIIALITGISGGIISLMSRYDVQTIAEIITGKADEINMKSVIVIVLGIAQVIIFVLTTILYLIIITMLFLPIEKPAGILLIILGILSYISGIADKLTTYYASGLLHYPAEYLSTLYRNLTVNTIIITAEFIFMILIGILLAGIFKKASKVIGFMLAGLFMIEMIYESYTNLRGLISSIYLIANPPALTNSYSFVIMGGTYLFILLSAVSKCISCIMISVGEALRKRDLMPNHVNPVYKKKTIDGI